MLAEGRQFNGAPFPASATAEGAQLNVPPSPVAKQRVTCLCRSLQCMPGATVCQAQGMRRSQCAAVRALAPAVRFVYSGAMRDESVRPMAGRQRYGVGDGTGEVMRFGEKLLVAVAVLLSAFGVVMIAGMLINILNHTSKDPLLTDLLLVLLIGVLPLVGGVRLYQHVRANAAARQADEWERAVLQVAKRHHGMVTAMDVASNSALTLEQAKDTLDQLNLKGFNEMDVSESGTIIYKFRV